MNGLPSLHPKRGRPMFITAKTIINVLVTAQVRVRGGVYESTAMAGGGYSL